MNSLRLARFASLILSLVLLMGLSSCKKEFKENICTDTLGKWYSVSFELFPLSIRNESVGDSIYPFYGSVKKEYLDEALEILKENLEDIYKDNLNYKSNPVYIEFDNDYNYRAKYVDYKSDSWHDRYKYTCNDYEIGLDITGMFIKPHQRILSILYIDNNILILHDERYCCLDIYLKEK